MRWMMMIVAALALLAFEKPADAGHRGNGNVQVFAAGSGCNGGGGNVQVFAGSGRSRGGGNVQVFAGSSRGRLRR